MHDARKAEAVLFNDPPAGLVRLRIGNVEQPNTQIRLDSLEARLSEAYKPGFGEMMGSIQVHHNKLWFAGVNANWKLAAFEIHEIQETLEQITKFQQEREESRMTGSLLRDWTVFN